MVLLYANYLARVFKLSTDQLFHKDAFGRKHLLKLYKIAGDGITNNKDKLSICIVCLRRLCFHQRTFKHFAVVKLMNKIMREIIHRQSRQNVFS